MHAWRFKERCCFHHDKKYLTSKGSIAGAFAIGIDASVFPMLYQELLHTNKAWDMGALRPVNQHYNHQCIILYPYIIICDTTDSDIRKASSMQNQAVVCNWNIQDFDFRI